MGWEKGRYYTRSLKINGKVYRHYIGAGEVAQLIAKQVALDHERRQKSQSLLRLQKKELQDEQADVEQFDDFVDLLLRAVLVSQGFHQHHRGEWRRRREQTTKQPESIGQQPTGAEQQTDLGCSIPQLGAQSGKGGS